jgi:signal transduction histidine kinase
LYALTIIARHALRSDAFGLTADCAGQGIISSSGLAPQAEVFIREILTGDGAPPAPRPPGWHVLEVEVRRGGARVGRLAAARASGQPYGPEESLVGDALATQAVRILDRGEDLARNRRLTRALTRLEGRLASTSTEQPTKTELEVVHAARLALGFDGAALYLRQAPDQPHKLVCMDGRVPTAVSPGHETERGNATHDGLVSRSIPLKWGDHLAGDLVLFARSDRPAATLTPESVEFLSGRIGVSLGTSGLIESERHQRRLTEALQEASQAIDRALELEEVLDLILGQVMRAFGCDAANFSSYEGEVSRIIRAHGYERFGLSESEMLNVTFRADEFVNLRRMAMGEAVAVPDTAADEAWVYAPRFEWLRSWAGVPVRYGDTIFGFVMLDSSVPGTFDERATHRLQAFAAHAGAAMHNARLYNRLMREHTRLQLVHTIGRRFSGSLHRDEILDKLAIATTEALGGEGWAVFVPSQAGPGTYELVPTVGAGRSPTTGPDLDEAWVRSVAESFAPDIRSVDGPVGRRTQLAFPLTAGDRTYAVAVVSVVGDLAEPESWLDVLRPVGQQAGLALAKAEEHAAVQRRLAELTALQSIVRHVAGRLEVEAVLREVTRQLNKNLGFPAVQVFMREGEELILRQHSGPSIMVTRLSLGQGIVGRAARLARPEFIPDVRRDPDYIAGLIGTRAEAAVPILAEGSVIGVLNVEASEAEQLDRGALELLTLVADQLSIALQNASLYEAAQTNVEELEARVRERTSQLEQVLEQAVAAERVKAQFVADVSHELRTPLTNIGLYLDLLELSHDDRRGEYMSTLRRETDRLGRLIEQLLAMSHLDTGQAEFHLVPIDLNALLKVLIGDRARLIGRKGLKLELLPEPGLPLVQADPQYLMQVMTNLLSNAVNYTPSGGRISLMTGRSEWQDVAYATLTVRDTGPGIPDEEQGHIFDRFYRGVAARASGVAGTGLGLAISRDIMARHGGRLTVHSVRGSGSSFTLWIPLALASAA